MTDNDTPVVKKAQPIFKRKIRNFSEKYEKGKQIGAGPFGHIYHCWLRNDYNVKASAEENPIQEAKSKKQLLTLKILKKNLLSQKPAIDDLLVNEFKVLMDAR